MAISKWLQARGAAPAADQPVDAADAKAAATGGGSDSDDAKPKSGGLRAWFKGAPPPPPPSRYYRVPDDSTFAPVLPAYTPDLDAENRRSALRDEYINVVDSLRESRRLFKLRSARWKWWEKLACILPCAQWIGEYKIREDLPWDLLAALSVSMLVVPQSLSYALLAGVPSVWGLYGAFLPVLTYAVFGSSKQLSVGPVAVTSIIIGNGLKPIVPGAEFVSFVLRGCGIYAGRADPPKQNAQNSDNAPRLLLLLLLLLLFLPPFPNQSQHRSPIRTTSTHFNMTSSKSTTGEFLLRWRARE